MIECNITLEFESEKIANNTLESVKIDNNGYVKSMAEGKNIVSIIKAETPLSLIHSIEDFLICIKVAEQVASL